MKNLLWISTLLLSFACKEDDTGMPDYGTAQVTLNGQTTSLVVEVATPSLCIERAANVTLSLRNDTDNYTNQLSFTNVPLTPGSYEVKTLPAGDNNCEVNEITGGLFLMIADGDVIGDYYEVIEGMDSKITIASYDAGGNTLMGNFRVSLAYHQLGSMQRKVSAPDTIHFEQGEFQIFIQ